MLVCTCHSLWVACIRDLVVCPCIYPTRRGWHILESWWYALAYVPFTKWHVLETWQCTRDHMSLAMGGMYWRRSSIPVHTCHSSWVACTGDAMLYSCMCASYKVARTRDIMLEEGLTKGWWPWILRARLVVEPLYCIPWLLRVWQLLLWSFLFLGLHQWFRVPSSYFLDFVVAEIVVSLSMVLRLQWGLWRLCHIWVSKEFRWLLFG